MFQNTVNEYFRFLVLLLLYVDIEAGRKTNEY